MKKLLLIIFLLILIAGAYLGWTFLGPATGFKEDTKFLYIKTDSADKSAIMQTIKQGDYIHNLKAFQWLANQMKYWNSIKPGKYKIDKGESMLTIIRRLRNGQQTPVDLVITRIRTKENFARLTASKFEIDSTNMISFLNNADSMANYGVTPETAMTVVLPNTYTYFWNTKPENIYKKLYDESQKFWDDARKEKATQKGLSSQQAYILASIIEEETNAKTDKPNIASVYLNRIKINMPLQADPTVKFALKDFGIKRILHKHLEVESPYNTYRNLGLPPGPVTTPSQETINAVLDSPPTDYIYFVANSDFSGTHIFTTNYNDHLKFARQYQQELNRLDSTRKAKQGVN
jgi:UPF0755 protein